MRVNIDEAGREDETIPVDFTAGRTGNVADRRNFPAFNGQRSGVGRSTGPVRDSRILDQQIIRHTIVPPLLARLLLVRAAGRVTRLLKKASNLIIAGAHKAQMRSERARLGKSPGLIR